MKKLFLLLFVCLFLVGCSSSSEVDNKEVENDDFTSASSTKKVTVCYRKAVNIEDDKDGITMNETSIEFYYNNLGDDVTYIHTSQNLNFSTYEETQTYYDEHKEEYKYGISSVSQAYDIEGNLYGTIYADYYSHENKSPGDLIKEREDINYQCQESNNSSSNFQRN